MKWKKRLKISIAVMLGVVLVASISYNVWLHSELSMAYAGGNKKYIADTKWKNYSDRVPSLKFWDLRSKYDDFIGMDIRDVLILTTRYGNATKVYSYEEACENLGRFMSDNASFPVSEKFEKVYELYLGANPPETYYTLFYVNEENKVIHYGT